MKAAAIAQAAPLRVAMLAPLPDDLAQTMAALWWPIDRLAEGLAELARHSGLSLPHTAQSERATGPGSADGAAMAAASPAGRTGQTGQTAHTDPTGLSGLASLAALSADSAAADLPRWVDWAAERLGLEAETVDAALPDLPALLRGAGPALLPWTQRGAAGFLLLLGNHRGQPRLLAPDLRPRRIPLATLRNALAWDAEAPLLPQIDHLLQAAAVPSGRQAAVRQALLRERLASQRCGHIHLLRLPAGAGFWQQLKHAGLPRRVGLMLGLFALLYALELAGWGLIGSAVLDGRLDLGWMTAWLMLLLSLIPLRLAGEWLDASFALDAGRILKARLLAGALRLDADQVRRQGVGHLLGRVIESQALESLVLGGGLSVLVALLELVFAAWVLGQGAAGGLHLALLAGWTVLTVAMSGRYLARLRHWTLQRLALTHGLIERMVGHRTRLAQERAGRRDAVEDNELQAYQQSSLAMDRAAVPVLAGMPAGWLLLGLAGLVPAFVAGQASPGLLAVSLGGILIAQRALGGITGGLGALGRAAVAWQQVSAMFEAGVQTRAALPLPPGGLAAPIVSSGARAEASADASADDGNRASADRLPIARTASPAPATPLIDAHGLHFGYRAGAPVLHDADLVLQHGERVLLEGASGGGKSTLASLLTGLRQPQSGLLLINGLDRHTLGEQWHKLATSAPQFNDNHVLSGSLAFNLLMGRQWPASPADLADALTLCEALGLGPLIARMPAGLMQRVGETGWQLSHGERSRIFLARALLQDAPLTILDESFAALDPPTLALCLRCALDRAQTLVVIAHP